EAVVAPLEVLTLTGPPALLLSTWNWSVPVGVPAPGLGMLTVAVKVTLGPATDGLTEATNDVVLLALVTVCVIAVELLAAKLLSPPYETVMGWLVMTKLEALKLAVVIPPLVLSVPWPILVPPSEKITRPLGLLGPLPL